MQNFYRNVGHRFMGNQFQLNLLIRSIDKTVPRYSSTLSTYQGPANQRKLLSSPLQQKREQLTSLIISFYSTNSEKQSNDEEPQSFSKLFDDPIKTRAAFFSFFSLTLKTTKIRNSYDRDFNINEFVEGTKQAVEVVSNRLASADYDGLHGLVTDELIERLRDRIDSFNETERKSLQIKQEDIIKEYVSSIDITEKDDGVIVDIFMIYHLMKNYKKMTDEKITPIEFLKNSSKLLDENFFILNYRFTKEFSKNANSDWIVSFLNHINIAEDMAQQSKSLGDLIKKGWEEYENERKKKK